MRLCENKDKMRLFGKWENDILHQYHGKSFQTFPNAICHDLLTTTTNEESMIQEFLVNLKHLHQNY